MTESGWDSGEVRDVAPEGVRNAISAAQRYLLSIQHADGHWCGELQGDSILESEYILMKFILGQERRVPVLPSVTAYLDVFRIDDHMPIRDDIPIRADDETAALAPHGHLRNRPIALALPARGHFITPEDIERGGPFRFFRLERIDHHHARRELLENGTESLIEFLEQRGGVLPTRGKYSDEEAQEATANHGACQHPRGSDTCKDAS